MGWNKVISTFFDPAFKNSSKVKTHIFYAYFFISLINVFYLRYQIPCERNIEQTNNLSFLFSSIFLQTLWNCYLLLLCSSPTVNVIWKPSIIVVKNLQNLKSRLICLSKFSRFGDKSPYKCLDFDFVSSPPIEAMRFWYPFPNLEFRYWIVTLYRSLSDKNTST